jgi:hypothetical protein
VKEAGGGIGQTVMRQGIAGSAGVLERGKRTGRIAWEPGRSRLRLRESKHVWGRSRAGNKVVRQVTAKKTGTRERWRRCRLGACSNGISPSLTSTPI